MVRVGFGKKILASLAAAVMLAGASSLARAASVDLSGSNLTETTSQSDNIVTLLFGTSTTANPPAQFTLTVSDQKPPTPYNFDTAPVNPGDGQLVSFVATLMYDTTLSSGGGFQITGGAFDIKLANGDGSGISDVTGALPTGPTALYFPGAHSFSFTGVLTTFPTQLGPISIINFGGTIPSTVGATATVNIDSSTSNSTFDVKADLGGTPSNPTPLPAAAWGGLSLMGALGVGAMARRRRA